MFSVLILFELSLCCCSRSSCCCACFVSASTQFSDGVELTSLNASLDKSSLGHFSKGTICLAVVHRSCTVAVSFWFNNFLLIKFGKAFWKTSLILLLLSFAASLRMTCLAAASVYFSLIVWWICWCN